MELSDFKKMTEEELNKELNETYKELFNLRMQNGTGQLTKPHLIKAARRNIARIKTVITEKAKKGVKDE
jgi:large subunit ribosomal protein L29